MKPLAWAVIIAAVAWYFFAGPGENVDPPAQTGNVRGGSDLSSQEFTALFDDNKSLADLADDDFYTIIEVYLDSCAICRRLEKGFQPFLDKRRDVLIRRVRFPETGLNINLAGASPEEVRRQTEEIGRRIEAYRICGTPHVEIYGPDGRVLSADDCGRKGGTEFLRQWISAETGIPARNL